MSTTYLVDWLNWHKLFLSQWHEHAVPGIGGWLQGSDIAVGQLRILNSAILSLIKGLINWQTLYNL